MERKLLMVFLLRKEVEQNHLKEVDFHHHKWYINRVADATFETQFSLRKKQKKKLTSKNENDTIVFVAASAGQAK